MMRAAAVRRAAWHIEAPSPGRRQDAAPNDVECQLTLYVAGRRCARMRVDGP